jgi:hypothetical protein
MWLYPVGLVVTLALAILVAPFLASAQPRGRVAQIGMLLSTSPTERGPFGNGL